MSFSVAIHQIHNSFVFEAHLEIYYFGT